MTEARRDLVHASVQRIAERMATLLRDCPDETVAWCAYVAALEEAIVNGDPRSPEPVGFINAAFPIQPRT